MNIGDKVRSLHGNEEGTITKFVGKGIVEIEIEDGFTIPIKSSELVLVHKEEGVHFRNEIPEKVESIVLKEQQSFTSGLYLGFVPINEQVYNALMINNTNSDILFTVYKGSAKESRGVVCGIVKAKSTFEVFRQSIQTLEEESYFTFQYLKFIKSGLLQSQFETKSLKLIAKKFFKPKVDLPLVKEKGVLFQIDDSTSSPLSAKPSPEYNSITGDEIVQSMFGNSSESITFKAKVFVKEIDLHIEKLNSKWEFLESNEILSLQIAAFEEGLDNALLSNVESIKFIHGVGNGTLRHQIHKRLSKHPHVVKFKDVNKDRFGYGATEVYF